MSSTPFLKKGLTVERAAELCHELGFLGIVDLVTFMAAGMDGAIECKGPRVIVQIKKKPRAKKVVKR